MKRTKSSKLKRNTPFHPWNGAKSFQATFHAAERADVVLIQPHLIQNIPDNMVCPVQWDYFKHNGFTSGESFADLPVEPNWGLIFIGDVLKRSNYSVLHLDLNLYDYVKHAQTGLRFTVEGKNSDLEAIIRKKKATVYGISCMTCSINKGIAIARRIKEMHPDSYVVFGGIHPALFAEQLIQDHPGIVDFVIKGEGEVSFLALLDHLHSEIEPANWPAIPGVVYAVGDEIKSTQPQVLDLKKQDNPFNFSLWPRDVPFIPRVNLSRGCMGSCLYCSANRSLGGGYRTRTMENIITDLDNCHANGYRKIMFGDLSFGCNKELAIAVCQHIITHNLNIKWWCQMRLMDCDSDLLDIMKKAGCKQIALGFESSDTEMLDNVSAGKRNKRDLHEVCKEIKSHGIGIQGYFIIGLPNETNESAEKTIAFMEEMLVKYDLAYTHISVCVPFPGTDLYENPAKYNITIVDNNFDNYLMNSDLKGVAMPVFDGEHLTRQEIYVYWLKALATAHKHLSKRKLSLLEDKYNNVFCERFLKPQLIPTAQVSYK